MPHGGYHYPVDPVIARKRRSLNADLSAALLARQRQAAKASAISARQAEGKEKPSLFPNFTPLSREELEARGISRELPTKDQLRDIKATARGYNITPRAGIRDVLPLTQGLTPPGRDSFLSTAGTPIAGIAPRNVLEGVGGLGRGFTDYMAKPLQSLLPALATFQQGQRASGARDASDPKGEYGFLEGFKPRLDEIQAIRELMSQGYGLLDAARLATDQTTMPRGMYTATQLMSEMAPIPGIGQAASAVRRLGQSRGASNIWDAGGRILPEVPTQRMLGAGPAEGPVTYGTQGLGLGRGMYSPTGWKGWTGRPEPTGEWVGPITAKMKQTPEGWERVEIVNRRGQQESVLKPTPKEEINRFAEVASSDEVPIYGKGIAGRKPENAGVFGARDPEFDEVTTRLVQMGNDYVDDKMILGYSLDSSSAVVSGRAPNRYPGYELIKMGTDFIDERLGFLSKGVRAIQKQVTPIKQIPAELQSTWLGASRYDLHQKNRIQQLTYGFQRMLSEAFGEQFLAAPSATRTMMAKIPGVPPVPKTQILESAQYMGKVTDANRQHLGALWHILDQGVYNRTLNPKGYKGLTAKQQAAIKAINDSLDVDQAFTINLPFQVGGKSKLDVTRIAGAYLPHRFKNVKQGENVLAGYRQSYGKKRKLDTDDWLEVAQKKNAEIDTDVISLYTKRLHLAADRRTKYHLINLARKFYGGVELGKNQKAKSGFKQVTGHQRPDDPQQYKIVGEDLDRFAFPEDKIDDVVGLYKGIYGRFSPGGLEERASKAVDWFRNILLNLDFSVGGMRQGFLLFSRSPAAWADSMRFAMRVATHGDQAIAQDLFRNGPRYNFWNRHGLQFAQTPLDTQVTSIGRRIGIEAIPVVGWLNKMQFGVIMRQGKLRLADSMLSNLQAIRDGRALGISDELSRMVQSFPIIGKVARISGGRLYEMTDQQLAEEVAKQVNNWLGGIEWAQVGLNRGGFFRRAGILTEGWTRAQIGVILNAPKLSPAGIMARRMIVQELTMALTLLTAIEAAANRDFNPQMFNPTHTDFATLRMPWGNMRLMPHHSLYRSVARGLLGGKVFQDQPDEEFSLGGALGERAEPFWKFMEGRQGQIPRAVMDLKTGTDFAGRPIDSQWQHIMQSLMPISVQSLWEGLEKQYPFEVTAAMLIGELAGGTSFPPTVVQNLNKVAQRKHGQNYYDLQPYQRAEIKLLPEMQEVLLRDSTEDQRRRLDIQYDSHTEQLEKDGEFEAGVLSGRDWRRDHSVRQRERQNQLDAHEEQAGTEFKKWEKTAGEKARREYYDVIDEQFGDDFDYDEFHEWETGYLAALPSQQRKYIEDNKSSMLTPLGKEYKMGRRKWSRYFDVLYDVLRVDDPEETQKRLAAYRRWSAAGGTNREVEGWANPWLPESHARIRYLRELERDSFPELEEFLLKFGHITSPRNPAWIGKEHLVQPWHALNQAPERIR